MSNPSLNSKQDYNGDRLQCPVCDGVRLSVKDSRPHRGTVRRLRQCFDCEYRFYTMEIETDADCTIDEEIIQKFNSNITVKWTPKEVVVAKLNQSIGA